MGFIKKIGLGKKEPYRVPREAVALRTKIEAESRENFPHLARYKDLMRDAAQVYALLDAEVAKKTYAEEAAKLGDEIRKKLDGLAERIRTNAREAAAEAGGDSGGDAKMDMLAQKSMRDSAKTLVAAFLEAHERLFSCIQDAAPGCSGAVDAASTAMIRAMASLNEDYFTKHGNDSEIAGLKELVLSKTADIDRSFNENRSRLRELALESAIEPQVRRLLTASRGLSSS